MFLRHSDCGLEITKLMPLLMTPMTGFLPPSACGQNDSSSARNPMRLDSFLLCCDSQCSLTILAQPLIPSSAVTG